MARFGFAAGGVSSDSLFTPGCALGFPLRCGWVTAEDRRVEAVAATPALCDGPFGDAPAFGDAALAVAPAAKPTFPIAAPFAVSALAAEPAAGGLFGSNARGSFAPSGVPELSAISAERGSPDKTGAAISAAATEPRS